MATSPAGANASGLSDLGAKHESSLTVIAVFAPYRLDDRVHGFYYTTTTDLVAHTNYTWPAPIALGYLSISKYWSIPVSSPSLHVNDGSWAASLQGRMTRR